MRYRPELDGIRALAVLAVMATHSHLPYTSGGWMGVDVFFVLSGYLITSLLLAEHDRHGGISLRRFYSRRALRLYPALLVLLLVGLPFFHVLGDGGTLTGYARTALGSGLYIEDITEGFDHSLGGFAHTWSLAVEEQFYLIWPIVLILMLRWRMRLLTWTVVAACVSFALMILTYEHFLPGDAYYLPWTRSMTLLVGCGLAIILRSGRRPRVVQSPLFGGVAVAAVVGIFAASSSIFLLTPKMDWEAPIAISTAALVWYLSTSISSPLIAILAWKPLVWLGRRSYGVYLYHFPILGILLAYLPFRRSILALIMVVLTIIVAAISYRFVELPFLRLKGRFSSSRPAESAAASAGATAT